MNIYIYQNKIKKQKKSINSIIINQRSEKDKKRNDKQLKREKQNRNTS